MRAFLQILTPALVLAAATIVPPLRAAEAGADPEIENMISAQIDAFGHDDAAKAESFASPGIKTMFPEPGAFLGMVKTNYPALVHPRSTHFEPTSTSDAGTEQKVTVVDGNGAVWTAVYRLEKVDGHWVISGCILLKTLETSA